MRQASIAAYVCAAITFLIVTFTISVADIGVLEHLGGYWLYGDVLFLALCGYFVSRYSRAAAILLLSNLLLSLSVNLYTFRHVDPLILAIGGIAYLALLYLYARGLVGAWSYHRRRSREDPAYRAAPSWSYFVGGATVVVAIPVLIAGLMGLAGLIPASGVVSGDQLLSSNRSWLVAAGITEADEEILLFYSTGLFSIHEEGNILTDHRVVSYEEVDGELYVYSADMNSIAGYEFVQESDASSDAVVEIFTDDGDSFLIILSGEAGGDVRFIEEMKRRLPSDLPEDGRPSQKI
ncbi:MAG: hypothetical protein AAF637_15665 [Pseudomonadota bacterium]